MTEKQELTVNEELQKELAAAANEEAALERPSLSNISLRAGVMTYMEQPVPNNEMDVIIISHAVERTLYLTPFDADNIVPPDCYALSTTGVDMRPADNVPSPQAEFCADCPNNEWGSGRGRGKACGERRRLLVAPASILTDGVEGTELAMLKVPPTSLKNWGTYVNKVRAALARPVWAVVTTVSVVPDAKTQFKVKFSTKETVNDAQLIGELRQLHAEGEVYTLQPFDMTPPAEADANSDKF